MEDWTRYKAKFGQADEIAARMTAKGPAPESDRAAFMSRFIGEAEGD